MERLSNKQVIDILNNNVFRLEFEYLSEDIKYFLNIFQKDSEGTNVEKTLRDITIGIFSNFIFSQFVKEYKSVDIESYSGLISVHVYLEFHITNEDVNRLKLMMDYNDFLEQIDTVNNYLNTGISLSSSIQYTYEEIIGYFCEVSNQNDYDYIIELNSKKDKDFYESFAAWSYMTKIDQ